MKNYYYNGQLIKKSDSHYTYKYALVALDNNNKVIETVAFSTNFKRLDNMQEALVGSLLDKINNWKDSHEWPYKDAPAWINTVRHRAYYYADMAIVPLEMVEA